MLGVADILPLSGGGRVARRNITLQSHHSLRSFPDHSLYFQEQQMSG